MVVESVYLDIKKNQVPDFLQAFHKAEPLIGNADGYISHSLMQCLDNNHRFLLTVQWKTLESHTVNFRQSAQYKKWKKLLHHFYDPFPTVSHFKPIKPI